MELDWNGPIQHEGLCMIPCPPDGSCFFHCILNAIYRPYLASSPDERAVMVKTFRRELSDYLSKKDDSGATIYDKLSRGQLKIMSKDIPEFSLEAMKSELLENGPVDNLYNEFISDMINKDIYIVDLDARDIYITGSDVELYYKGRDSIVIGYTEGHYNLIGIKKGSDVVTNFDCGHSFISQIRRRYMELISK